MTNIKIGKIRGIEIYLDFSWFFIFILLSWTLATYYFPRHYPHWPKETNWIMGILASLLLFASVLLHELAHSIVAQKQGEEVKRITLFILGGVAQITKEPETPIAEFKMAIAGPLMSLALGISFWGLKIILYNINKPLMALSSYLSFINLLLAGFNLLPGYPMDGGRILRAIIWKWTGNLKKATHIASKTGQGMAIFFIFFGLLQIFGGFWLNGLWMILIGFFLYQASLKSYQQIMIKEFLKNIKAKNLMTQDFIIVHPETPLRTLVDEYILKRGQRAFFVGDDEIMGIVCLEDIKRISSKEWAQVKVKEIMTPRSLLQTVSPEDDAMTVLQRLTTHNIHQIPVMENNHLIGVITRNDLLRWIQVRSEWGE